MDRLAIEAFLFSADFGEDNYLLASSSSSESEPECCCSDDSDSSTEKLKPKKSKLEGFAEVTVPLLIDSGFKKHFRVSKATCAKITELIHDDFNTAHKGGWEKITPTKAAYVLLWYLGNRETFKQISERFRITQSCAHNIIKVGSRNLSSKLHEYVRWPDNDSCEEESLTFYDISKINGIVGAIGMSHITILKPKNDQEKYMNMKNYYSIALQGIVTSNNKFIHLYACEGSLEPPDILKKSSVRSNVPAKLFENYFLVGNNSYPSFRWLVTPYQDKGNLTEKQKEFNECHNSACSIVNHTFGLLKERFPRLDHLENKDMTFNVRCILAACVVHNICIDQEDLCEAFLVDKGIFHYKIQPKEEEKYDKGKKEEVFNSFLANCKSESMILVCS